MTDQRQRRPSVRFVQTVPAAEVRRRLPRLPFGLVVCGVGPALIIRADLGLRGDQRLSGGHGGGLDHDQAPRQLPLADQPDPVTGPLDGPGDGIP